ncbi:MAG: transposase [Gloeocapsa sp. UFS-A4-WI-NPMV-4B04]|nr:transposase [Gloeocapsa sp. UFS-A4-WI-NPMV-4B04]
MVVPRSPSDFIVDTIQEWWNDLTLEEQQQTQKIQLKVDNGPESSGVRTQCLKRMVEFADLVAKPIHLLYYPPYHSKYNPIERCWGILEKHWNGAKLTDALTMLLWARSMTSERSQSCWGATRKSGIRQSSVKSTKKSRMP